MTRQVKSGQRAADHGEVITSGREVNAMLGLVTPETKRARPVEYYEFPNGKIVKIKDYQVYEYIVDSKTWKINHQLTCEFAYDRPYGEPCTHLRKKADISEDLPAFPDEKEFYPGNIVRFGAYPQESENDYSPISWLVLSTDGETALCIAEKALITCQYCNSEEAHGNVNAVYWENSVARKKCNEYFYEDAFSKDEKERIIPQTLSSVKLGRKCTDPVFLLSEDQVRQYFPSEESRKAVLTTYARINNALCFPFGSSLNPFQEPNAFWWLLPEEEIYLNTINGLTEMAYPKAVMGDGKINYHGRNIYHPDFTIRPCVRIRFANAKAGSGDKVKTASVRNYHNPDQYQTMRSRYAGCLLGGAVGDALGYPVEFLQEDAIFKKYGEEGIQRLEQAGQPALISDDTQMTLFAAEAIIYDINPCEAYKEWLGTQGDTSRMNDPLNPKLPIYKEPRMHHRRAPGNSCLSAIRNSKYPGGPTHPVNNSKGCGSVMRAAPYGLAVSAKSAYGDGDIGVYKMATVDAALTHGHPLAQASSCMLAQLIYHIVQYSPERNYRLEEVLPKLWFHVDQNANNQLQMLLEKAAKLALDESLSDLDGIHELGEGWVAEEALAIAVFCAVRYQNDFASAIRAAVNHKGDSDSTGAICGNILGAWLGKKAVEEAFNLDELELREVIEAVADKLYDKAEGIKIPKKSKSVKPLKDVGLKYTPLTKKAMKISFEAHKNQKDKSGMPYFIHPLHLAEQMETEAEICTALLHDVVEDGHYTLDDLRQAGFPEEIVKAVDFLTRRDYENYFEYVERAARNPIARRVKEADLRHNSDINRVDNPTEKDYASMRKYRMAMDILMG